MSCSINKLPNNVICGRSKMDRKVSLSFGVLSFIFLSILVSSEAKKLSPCMFPEIFIFGDSNSDLNDSTVTKPGWESAERPNVSQAGKIKRPFSDGRLIIDFITEEMKRPYLPSAYMDKNQTNFKKGASFAVGGSTFKQYEFWKPPYYFPRQIAEFIKFKGLAVNLQGQGKSTSLLPRPEDFQRALYIIDIGQNDVTKLMYGFSIPHDIEELLLVFQEGVMKLYNEGARTFWIHNTGPHGCLPKFFNLELTQWISGDLDVNGCNKFFNSVASEFNRKLKDKVTELRAQLKEAVITYVDVYAAKYKLFNDAKSLGFTNPLGVCNTGNISCSDPSEYIIWDGVHYTEAANRLVAQSILNGALSDPPLPITHSCYRLL